jgi:hypothetical protein
MDMLNQNRDCKFGHVIDRSKILNLNFMFLATVHEDEVLIVTCILRKVNFLQAMMKYQKS